MLFSARWLFHVNICSCMHNSIRCMYARNHTICIRDIVTTIKLLFNRFAIFSLLKLCIYIIRLVFNCYYRTLFSLSFCSSAYMNECVVPGENLFTAFQFPFFGLSILIIFSNFSLELFFQHNKFKFIHRFRARTCSIINSVSAL